MLFRVYLDSQIFVTFLPIFPLYTVSLILLQSENILYIIWMILNWSLYILWPRISLILMNISCELKMNVYFWLLSEYSISINLMKLIDYVIQVKYILSDFLLTRFISYWNRHAEVSNYYSAFLCFSFQFYQFFPFVFWCSVVRSYMLRIMYFWKGHFCQYAVSLILMIFHVLPFCLILI